MMAPACQLQRLKRRRLDPGDPDAGVLISVFNGQLDVAGHPVAEYIYTEIKAAPLPAEV
jgi:hypothetical protein